MYVATRIREPLYGQYEPAAWFVALMHSSVREALLEMGVWLPCQPCSH